MAYVLGVDLGTSYSAAAVGHDDGRVEMFALGQRAAGIPSVVVLRADGEILVGEVAERRAITEPARTAREFKRRLGDPVPLVIGGTPYGPEALLAILLRSIVEQVTRQLGGSPAHVVVTHPASYGPYKIDLLQGAARQADLGSVSFVSEPVAAAVHYAHLEQVPKGATIAVYDFGGGTFDATILETTPDGGFEAAGTPEGLERLGGVDFDEAVFRHVVGALGDRVKGLDPKDPAVQVGFARLRDECRRAKEALSSDSDATIPVALPGIQVDVRITRAEFEAMIEPRIAETVAALERAARSADVRMVELDRILLVGGTSRIPRIAERVRAATGRPVAVDVHPKHSVALGAARLGLEQLTLASNRGAGHRAPVADGDRDVTRPGVAPAPTSRPSPAGQPPSRSTRPTEPAARVSTAAAVREAAPPGDRRRPWLIPVAAGAAVLLLGGAAVASGLLTGGQGPSPGATTGAGAPTIPPAPSALPTLPPPASPLPPIPGAVFAEIARVERDGGRYRAEFTTTGFSPSSTGTHVHFFWDTVPPAQAGAPAPGPYVVYAGASPFTEFAPGTRPDGATAICVIVANADHTVVPGSGNCSPLP